MGYIHAELMAQYAEDAKQHDEPWELWQHGENGTWADCIWHPGWHTDILYRRKPRTIKVGDFEVPEPCRNALRAASSTSLKKLLYNITKQLKPC